MKPIHDLEIKNMLRMANDARDRAYVPYSGFRVGACIKGETGAYYLGCNVENVSYERAFDALAIVSDSHNFTVPCGICRQSLSEFCDDDMPVICSNGVGKYKVMRFGELFPYAFAPQDVRP